MTDKSVEYFLEKGVLTGSRAFGVENKNSDWDIAITCETFEQIIPFLDQDSILGGENSGKHPKNRLRNRYSVKFSLNNNETVNLIAFDTAEALEVIELINKEMNSLSIAALGPKEERHAAFEGHIDKYMTDYVLGIPEIAINDDEIPFDLNCYCDIDSF